MCGLGAAVVPPGPVAAGWGAERDAGAAEPERDVPTQTLRLPGFKARVILPLLGEGAEPDGLLGWPRRTIPNCLSGSVTPRTLQILIC